MYLIDGNNVIGGRVGWHRDKEGSRRRLLQELSRWGQAQRVRLAVVFDGAPDPVFPEGAIFRGVRIYYARHGSDADERIVQMVEATRDKKSLTVVTSDRTLMNRVRVCGVQVVRSGEFRRQLDETPIRPDQEADLNPELGPIDQWMRYFGVEDGDNDEGPRD